MGKILGDREFLGEVTFNGNVTFEDTFWDDLRVGAQNVQINPLSSKPDFGTFVGGTRTFLFDPNDVEDVFFSAQMPHSYKLGTDIYPHVHWSPTDADTGDVVWGLECSFVSVSGVFPSTTTSFVTTSGVGTAYTHQVTGFDAIPGSGLTGLSTMILCRLFRDADGSEGSGSTDDYTGDAAFLEFDIHFQKDSPGSDEPFTK